MLRAARRDRGPDNQRAQGLRERLEKSVPVAEDFWPGDNVGQHERGEEEKDSADREGSGARRGPPLNRDAAEDFDDGDKAGQEAVVCDFQRSGDLRDAVEVGPDDGENADQDGGQTEDVTSERDFHGFTCRQAWLRCPGNRERLSRKARAVSITKKNTGAGAANRMWSVTSERAAIYS